MSMRIWKWTIIRTDRLNLYTRRMRDRVRSVNSAYRRIENLLECHKYSEANANIYAKRLQEYLSIVDPLWFVHSKRNLENWEKANEAANDHFLARSSQSD